MAKAQKKTSATKTNAKAQKPEVKPRILYMDTDLGERDENGQLVGQPVDFDSKLHLKPKREDFANGGDFLEWQAAEADAKAEHFAGQASSYRAQAEEFRKYGDPEKRKLAIKRQRLIDQLAALDEALDADGTELAE